MDVVLHIIGACSDTHSHIDLIDFLVLGGTSLPAVVYIKHKIKILFKNVKKEK